MTTRRFFCLILYLPFRWLAQLTGWAAEQAFVPLYRENNRIYEMRKHKQVGKDGKHGG